VFVVLAPEKRHVSKKRARFPNIARATACPGARPEPSANPHSFAGNGVRVSRDVTCRIDIARTGAQVFVDYNAVIYGQAAAFGNAVRGDTLPQNHQLGLNRLSVAELHPILSNDPRRCA